jgi:hypothetical protein
MLDFVTRPSDEVRPCPNSPEKLSRLSSAADRADGS